MFRCLLSVVFCVLLFSSADVLVFILGFALLFGGCTFFGGFVVGGVVQFSLVYSLVAFNKSWFHILFSSDWCS